MASGMGGGVGRTENTEHWTRLKDHHALTCKATKLSLCSEANLTIFFHISVIFINTPASERYDKAVVDSMILQNRCIDCMIISKNDGLSREKVDLENTILKYNRFADSRCNGILPNSDASPADASAKGHREWWLDDDERRSGHRKKRGMCRSNWEHFSFWSRSVCFN
ncbi:unnamed protein product [Acanthoscelides obtectus]|uniref:Uncharacterized protein n=1 Tax=Acanthoscelides obtectus TaxID=200917 RepID=A0A9P0KWE7_ACAOB|nr:unnamed protein product [Acanthoscelides obtectus]CAK1677678.1 hypothetical protein AOBTE_LOCUS31482 [Acanthoscelides obtectus]